MLYHNPPPFDGYQEWFRIPTSAADRIEHPATFDPNLSDGAKDVMNALVKLGPRYHYHVPMAAVLLDAQIQTGIINLAVTGQPGRFRPIPLVEFAHNLNSGTAFHDQIRERSPGWKPQRQDADTVAFHIHDLHIHGLLVLDNDDIANLALGGM